MNKENTAEIQQKLEQRILHGLACEWETALWVLDRSYRERLSKPIFSLGDLKKRWGHFSEEKREICLSRDLVLNHSWDAVQEVLKHEIAHQLAHELLGADGEPPHGPSYMEACRLLRANPKASGNYKPLDERFLGNKTSREDRILVRIKKLMALAQSKNQHEAEAAMEKTHQLIGKHNIDLLKRDEDRHFISVFVGKPALRHFREENDLANLIQDFYFVHNIWVPAYVVGKGKRGNVLEMTGTIQNVKIAVYVHDFVKHYVDSQWTKYNENRGLNRYRKSDFAVGIIEGFRSKMESQHFEKGAGKKLALVRIEDPLLKEHISYKYPRTISVRQNALRRDRHVLDDGMRLGKKLVISKGIEEKSKGKRLLIESGRDP
ncbi:MAG: DUF2786 domain-containing protein [Deltaproteobacteria bacterium]|nr:DUF2786 domain-containing protein [Deltaproteobacteria bacterium]